MAKPGKRPPGISTDRWKMLQAWQAFHPGKKGYAGQAPDIVGPTTPKAQTFYSRVQAGAPQRAALATAADQARAQRLMAAAAEAFKPRARGRPERGPGAAAGAGAGVPSARRVPTPPGPGKPEDKKGKVSARFYEPAPAFAPKQITPALEDITTEAPRQLRPGVVGVPFPGSPGEWLTRAMQIKGYDPNDPELRPALEEGARQEGNENVFQHGYTDVNTGRDPAFGPTQVIGSTFRANQDPRYGNRFNPIHGWLATINLLERKPGGIRAGARYFAQPGGYG